VVLKESGCGLFKTTFSIFLEALRKPKKITFSKTDIQAKVWNTGPVECEAGQLYA
jgi:hypothetical protein